MLSYVRMCVWYVCMLCMYDVIVCTGMQVCMYVTYVCYVCTLYVYVGVFHMYVMCVCY